jgi:hypothetical protein
LAAVGLAALTDFDEPLRRAGALLAELALRALLAPRDRAAAGLEFVLLLASLAGFLVF